MTAHGKSALVLVAVLLAACQQEVVKPGGKDSAAEIDAWSSGFADPQQAAKQAAKQSAKPKGPVVMAREDGPAWDWSDPCVENLHELTGLLLLYYQVHHELPASLGDLPVKTLAGGAAGLTCPASGKEYVYVREGLVPPLDIVPEPQRSRGGDRIILYDAEPAHEITQHLTDGTKDWDVKKKVRYGVVLKPPTLDGSLTMQVVPVEQTLLDAYLRETQRRNAGQKVAPLPVTPAKKVDTGGLW